MKFMIYRLRNLQMTHTKFSRCQRTHSLKVISQFNVLDRSTELQTGQKQICPVASRFEKKLNTMNFFFKERKFSKCVVTMPPIFNLVFMIII